MTYSLATAMLIVTAALAFLLQAWLPLVMGPIAPLTTLAVYPPIIWSALALASKRLHDRGRSAGWLVAFVLVPALCLEIGSSFISGRSNGPVALIPCAIGLGLVAWGLVELCLLPGTRSGNRHGPTRARRA